MSQRNRLVIAQIAHTTLTCIPPNLLSFHQADDILLMTTGRRYDGPEAKPRASELRSTLHTLATSIIGGLDKHDGGALRRDVQAQQPALMRATERLQGDAETLRGDLVELVQQALDDGSGDPSPGENRGGEMETGGAVHDGDDVEMVDATKEEVESLPTEQEVELMNAKTAKLWARRAGIRQTQRSRGKARARPLRALKEDLKAILRERAGQERLKEAIRVGK
ncbi:hypothetical protein DM02DRAFT_654779 [Periconia macrospinosa]|uniref:Uncharacterized protein n=1 Tax=Periconia macrospinosa TaxID=97972 RepID=A0A2V1DS90_9PLEO|nr:hypothetical protein DM02DRAFT_654779 [Periconia macrospinosa]